MILITVKYITDYQEHREKIYEFAGEICTIHMRNTVGKSFRTEYAKLRKQKPNEGENLIDDTITEQSES